MVAVECGTTVGGMWYMVRAGGRWDGVVCGMRMVVDGGWW